MADLLPDFPLDEQTLDLLMQAIDPWAYGDPDAMCSSLEPFLLFVSRMAGSDPDAIDLGDSSGIVMRDACYSSHDLIRALVTEVRRLRR